MSLCSTWINSVRFAIFAAVSALALAMTTPSNASAAQPVITFFGVGHLTGDWWELYGTIDDDNPDYCEVYFSGLLEGYSVDVSSNGEFGLVLEIPRGNSGMVGATAVNPDYEWSDTRWDYVYNY